MGTEAWAWKLPHPSSLQGRIVPDRPCVRRTAFTSLMSRPLWFAKRARENWPWIGQWRFQKVWGPLVDEGVVWHARQVICRPEYTRTNVAPRSSRLFCSVISAPVRGWLTIPNR